MRTAVLVFHALLWAAAAFAAAPTPVTVIPVELPGGTTDCTPEVRNAIESCPGGNIRLEFEPGTYHFYPEKAPGRYLAVSNNDNGYKRIVFDFANASHVTVQGHRTAFVFHGQLVPFCFTGCKQVEVSGISIDYDYPFVFEGTVIGSDPAKKSFTLQVHPDNPYRIKGKRFFFKGYDWESALGENIVFDASTRRPAYHTSLYEHPYTAGELQAEELSPGIVRFTGAASAGIPPAGTVYTDKGPHGENRHFPGFIVQHCSDVRVRNVTVYRSGAMAFVAERSENLTLDAFDVYVPEGSGRMISASADATHFVGCRGSIELVNCRFESMLDDAANVHGVYMKVVDLIDSHTVGAAFGHFQQEGYDFGSAGDSVAIVDRSGLEVLAKGFLRTIRKTNENYYRLTTDVDLSPFRDKKLSIANLSHNPAVRVANCSVKYNRARSLLISTSAPVLIENNYFSSMMAGIRICGDANYWFESGPVREAVIRNNTFEEVGIGGHAPQAVLQIDPVIPAEARGRGYYHGTIRFENNVIRTFDAQVIYGLSIDKLVIRNNRFICTGRYRPLFPDLSVIDVQYCRNLLVEYNDYGRWSEGATISVKKCLSPVIRNEKKLPVVANPNKYFYRH